MHAAPGLNPGHALEVLDGTGRLVHQEAIVGLRIRDKSRNGRVPVTDNHRVPATDAGQVLTEMGFELGDLGALHGHM